MVAQSSLMPNALSLTSMVFQWGQFIDHDMDLTEAATPSESFNISIPSGDPIFNPVIPMPLSRSKYAIDQNGVRQQMNSITSFLDASMVYGSDSSRAAALRTNGGYLLTGSGNLLPGNTMNLPNGDNGDPNRAQYYVAGDVRVNEQIGLTAMHTLFMREHNRQVDLLWNQHSGWDEDQIFEQARKIVGAEIQSITYREFLPALLGSAAPDIASTYDPYNPNVDQSIANEFATAFFRVGHTMLPTELLRIQNDGSPVPGGPVSLRDSFFRPNNLSGTNELEFILKGLTSQQQQEINAHIVDDVRNFLFGEPTVGAGFDLAALNIQRGRDHGLPDYNTLRQAYGLSPVGSINDITSDPDVRAALLLAYGDESDIDAWVGALAEDHLPGMAVGPLVAAALIDQFTRLRDGDRFWFTRDSSLSEDELDWLENVRLCDIILLNTDITNMQSNVFLMVPEPSTLALTLLGGVWIGLRVRWGRRA